MKYYKYAIYYLFLILKWHVVCNVTDLELNEDELKHFALAEIESILLSNNMSLADFPTMHSPDMSLLIQVQNRLIYD